MDFMTNLLGRRSIRSYESTPVAPELVTEIMRAAQAAPSAKNGQPWHFVVIDDSEVLKQVSALHSHCRNLYGAPMAIVVCMERDNAPAPVYLEQDGAAATQNILLAAHGLGLGTVWCGLYPREEWVTSFSKLLNLPTSMVPFSLIAVGHPAEHPEDNSGRYQESRVHHNCW